MFTGIITNQARVVEKEKQGGQVRFRFSFSKPEKRKLELGESVAVNGVCLTVAAKSGKTFDADVMNETLKATSLGTLKTGEPVNTERALRFGDPVGGHFLSGHVDGAGKVRKIEKQGKNISYWIEAPGSLKKYLVKKGSIGVDGISLTIQDVKGRLFKVSIVPHTLKETVLAGREKGQTVNLEADRYALLKKQDARAGANRAETARRIQAMKKQGF